MCGGGGGSVLVFVLVYIILHNMNHTYFSARVSYFVHFVHFLRAHTVLIDFASCKNEFLLFFPAYYFKYSLTHYF